MEVAPPVVHERSLVRVLVADATTNKVLVLQRSSKERFGAGLWEILQGSRENGETPDVAAFRELEEEIGLTRSVFDNALTMVVSTDHFSIDNKAGFQEDWSNINYVMVDYGLENTLGEITLDEDHDDYSWVSVQEAKELLGDNSYSAGGQRLLDLMPHLSEKMKRMSKMLENFS